MQGDLLEVVSTLFPRKHSSAHHPIVSSAALFLYDYVLTLDMEVELIWFAPMTWVKLLYLIQRYLPFVDTASLLLYGAVTPGLSTQECTTILNICHWMHTIGMTVSEVVLTLRAWAICQEQFHRLSTYLIIFFALYMLPTFVVMTDLFRFTEFTPAPLGTGRQNVSDKTEALCIVYGGPSMVYLAWILSAIYRTVILCLLVYCGYPACKYLLIQSVRTLVLRVRTDKNRKYATLFNVAYRDGALYYLLIITLSIASVVVILTNRGTFNYLLMTTIRVLHVVLTSRSVLHIRQAIQQDAVCYDENGSLHLPNYLDEEIGREGRNEET
ncbi:hypothetical protein VNI00_006088 [Paramarasmius palmivorus]|uniref:DUF6533 domain-containing protein n=1 Tax=Paramarasmius palmivorus TaxID=297713 RepID=A0AAW0D7J0_9AGAR